MKVTSFSQTPSGSRHGDVWRVDYGYPIAPDRYRLELLAEGPTAGFETRLSLTDGAASGRVTLPMSDGARTGPVTVDLAFAGLDRQTQCALP